jgi:putative ABC transport system permease protein
MSAFTLIRRNMRHSLGRTVLTTATIALATFIYAVLVAVPGSMDRMIADASRTLRLVVTNKTGPWYDLPTRYCNEILSMPGCVACVSITGWPAQYRDVSNPIFAAAVGGDFARVFPDYRTSSAAQAAFARERRAAIAGNVLIAKNHWKIGQLITLQSTSADRMRLDFVLVGDIPSGRYPNVFVFRRDYLEESLKKAGLPRQDLAWQLFVRVDSATHLGMLAHEIDTNFDNSDYETRTVSESDFLADGLASLGNIRGIVISLSVVVILTVLLIAANSTAMMVRERMAEVAVMRTLGFTRARVAMMLVAECAAMGLGGGALGAGLAYLLFKSGYSLELIGGGAAALWVTPLGAFSALIVAIGIAILSGALPILRAVQIPPALAFRAVI